MIADKYNVMINGVIKKGTQKYKDFRRDYWYTGENNMALSYEALARGYAVKLEPLHSLSKKTRDRIRADDYFTPTEIIDMVQKGLKEEGLDNLYHLKIQGNKVWFHSDKGRVNNDNRWAANPIQFEFKDL